MGLTSTERALWVVALLSAQAAQAWPVDSSVEVEVGAEKFQKAAALSWVDVENPKVLSAEPLPSGELLLTGVSAGETYVLLYGDSSMAVWRVRVKAKGERSSAAAKADIDSAKKACPELT